MPKLKTNSALKRRFRVTGTGKLMRTKMGKSHLRRRKPKRVKRTYSQSTELHPSDHKRLKSVLPKGLR
ncbi:MAG: 50S ribosomal protein L35 [Chloroflexi bacterium]|mgnify:CR=1 FL=1|nr:50S ribosomal protein L35 [Chloroflexota bacterium]